MKLASFHKVYFTVADLEKILTLPRKSVYVTLHRLVKSGLLLRLRRNAYTIFNAAPDVEKIVNEIYWPCYLSFESALSVHGILSQLPHTLRFATTRTSKKMSVGESAVELTHLKPSLFYGYKLENGRNIATPEKALLDQLYLVSRGQTALKIEELDLRHIDKTNIEEYAKKFPTSMKPLLDKVKKYIGTTPITTEANERIQWP